MGVLDLRWLVALCLLAVLVMVGANVYAVDVENMIRNGDFEEGLIEWNLRQSEGAVAQMKEDTEEPLKGESCVFIEIDNVAGTAWHLALYQEGHAIEKDETYTFAIWAKAEGLRPVTIYIEQAADPWDEYGRQRIEVNEEWQEYWTTFTAAASSPVWPRIALGESDVAIWVDNVRFYTGDYVEDEDIGTQKAVNPACKFAITWAEVKHSR